MVLIVVNGGLLVLLVSGDLFLYQPPDGTCDRMIPTQRQQYPHHHPSWRTLVVGDIVARVAAAAVVVRVGIVPNRNTSTTIDVVCVGPIGPIDDSEDNRTMTTTRMTTRMEPWCASVSHVVMEWWW